MPIRIIIYRIFTVIHTENENVNVLELYRKYIKIHPQGQLSHLFLATRNGKMTKQAVGMNKIGTWMSKITKYLNLLDRAV